MISFACRKIQIEDVIKCSFNLNKTSYKVLSSMIKKDDWMSVTDIASAVGLERSGVQKAIKLLLKEKLISRRQKNIPSGGYVYFYRSISKQDIIDMLMSIIDRWEGMLREETKKWVNE